MEAPSAKWFEELRDAYNAGNLEAFLARFDSEVVVEPDPQWPEPGPVVGREAFRRFLRDWGGAWQRVRFELENIEQRGAVAILRCRWIVSGATSGAPVPTAFTVVTRHGANGLISGLWAFFDHEEALGLVESMADEER